MTFEKLISVRREIKLTFCSQTLYTKIKQIKTAIRIVKNRHEKWYLYNHFGTIFFYLLLGQKQRRERGKNKVKGQ